MKTIQSYLDSYQKRGYFPGAVAAVHYAGSTQYYCSGTLSPDRAQAAVTSGTIFDVASLTKPIVTTTAILQLVGKSKLSLTDPVSQYLSEFAGFNDKNGIQIQHLLTHTSGLPAWLPLYIFCDTPQQIIGYLATCELNATPASHVEYSCLGFILLAEIVRRLSGMTLARYAKQNIFTPLRMTQSCFNPTDDLRDQIAPTEMGNEFEKTLAGPLGIRYRKWRRYRLHGEVQDGNSHAINGEGGNAGLFSSARDVMRFATCILNHGQDGDHHVVKPELLEKALQSNTKGLNADRGLGWQMATSTRSSGSCLSVKSFGHNGFSGTSLWIDPLQKLIIILLTNRSYYGGDGALFGKVRAPFHDLVVNQVSKEARFDETAALSDTQ